MVLAKLGVTTVLVVCLGLSFMLGRLSVSQLAVWKRSNSAPPPVLLASLVAHPAPTVNIAVGNRLAALIIKDAAREKSGTAGSQMTCVGAHTKDRWEQSKRSMPAPPTVSVPTKPVSYGVGHERLARAHFADAACSRRMRVPIMRPSRFHWRHSPFSCGSAPSFELWVWFKSAPPSGFTCNRRPSKEGLFGGREKCPDMVKEPTRLVSKLDQPALRRLSVCKR